ncbi:hypothetical protein [Providencia sp. Me31A]|uniref:hypothetical protein n=1 Tax=Providencia sp. Me31A TaxID=3392637 RepID=UPI003D28FF57
MSKKNGLHTLIKKIIYNSPLNNEKIKTSLANAFGFISIFEVYKNIAKNINSGLINDITLPICSYANLQIEGNQSTIEELKTEIKNKLKSNNDYYSLISYNGNFS